MSDALLASVGRDAALHAALSGGDDYILAFTLASSLLPQLQAEGWPITVIGQAVEGQGVSLVDGQGQDVTPITRGYQHFRESR
jgi:thiamine-monophosphate kinase